MVHQMEEGPSTLYRLERHQLCAMEAFKLKIRPVHFNVVIPIHREILAAEISGDSRKGPVGKKATCLISSI